MSKRLNFIIEDTASFFYNSDRTENEEYLLNVILQLGKEYNSLVDNYNRLVYENETLKRKQTCPRRRKAIY